jgi:hypothetical protein
MNRLPLLLVLSSVLASCVPPPRRPEPGPGPEVIAAVELMYDDLSSRRWEALATHFLPEASLVFATPEGPKRMAPDKFIEMVKKNVEGKEIFEERMDTGAAVWSHQDLASVWSPFQGREGNGQDVREWSGIDSFTMLKVEGRWRISHVATYVNRPVKPK